MSRYDMRGCMPSNGSFGRARTFGEHDIAILQSFANLVVGEM